MTTDPIVVALRRMQEAARAFGDAHLAKGNRAEVRARIDALWGELVEARTTYDEALRAAGHLAPYRGG